MASFPKNAVQVGTDADGSQIYIGRAFHNGDSVPAKVIPQKKAAYIPYGGKEVLVTANLEVLRRVEYVWVKSANGEVPPHAVPFGKTAAGEDLYAGRANYQGSVTPGKIQRSHGCLYIAFNGQEIPIKQYEVLCLE